MDANQFQVGGQLGFPVSENGGIQRGNHPPGLSPAQQNELLFRQNLASIDVWKDAGQKDNTVRSGIQEFAAKLDLVDKKFLMRELASDGIFLDSKGALNRELRDAEDHVVGTKVICRAEKMQAYFYHGYRLNKKTVCLRIYSGDSLIVNLIDQAITVDKLVQAFRDSGYPLLIGRGHESVRDLVFSYFISHAIRTELPFGHGWNKMSTGAWHFEATDDHTMRGLGNE